MTRMLNAVTPIFRRIEREYTKAVLTAVMRVFGCRAAARFFAVSPLVGHTQARALWLQDRILTRHGREAALAMAFTYLGARPRPQLYRHLLCQTGPCRPTREEIETALPLMIAGARGRDAAMQGLVIGLLERGEAALLLDAAMAFAALGGEDRRARISAMLDPLRLQPLSGAAWTEGAPPPTPESLTPGVMEDFTPPPCGNRLLVMDEALSPGIIGHLASGAERMTLLRYGDLYGRLDIEAIRAAAPGVEITVEHARSRTGRFSQRYHAMHQATMQAAQEMTAALIAAAPWLGDLQPIDHGARQSLVLSLGDALFFRALRMNGVLCALKDPAFDSVIISFGQRSDVYKLVFSEPSLTKDPRIMIGCWSLSNNTRKNFPRKIRNIRLKTQDEAAPPGPAAFARTRPRSHKADVENVIQCLQSVGYPPRSRADATDPGRARIALVTSGNTAYLASAVATALHLERDFAVDVLWAYGRPQLLEDALQKATEDESPDSCLSQAAARLRGNAVRLQKENIGERSWIAFKAIFLTAMAEAAPAMLDRLRTDAAVRCAIECAVSDDLHRVAFAIIYRLQKARMLMLAEGYKAIVLCPIRESRNALFVTAARQAKTPSIAVEPHCLNAAYCRYGSIFADFTALYSDYFAEEYERHFGIPRDRSFVIGSSRLLRPKGFRSDDARRAARDRLGLGPDDPPLIAMPAQPMPALYGDHLCRMVVRAVMTLGRPARLILKPHPEENSSDIARYRAIITQENGDDICSIEQGSITDVISASNIVLVCYSVTALEAAIRERNVAVIGIKGAEYPMQYDKILGVPCCHTVDQTRAVIAEALDLGSEAASGIARFQQRHPHLYDNGVHDRLNDAVRSVIRAGEAGMRRAEDLPPTPFVQAPFREYLV